MKHISFALLITLFVLIAPSASAQTSHTSIPALGMSVETNAWTEPKRNPGKVVALGSAQLALQYGALIAMKPPNWQIHGNSLTPTWSKFTSNFTVAPVWSPETLGGGGTLGYLQADGDAWQTNVIGHGLQGSEIYLRMRQENYAAGASFLGGVLHSTVWEYLVEGFNETPSTWDLVYTPIGGAIIGEARYYLARELEAYDHTFIGMGLLAVVDPVGIVF